MPSPLTRCLHFIRANGGCAAVIRLAARKLRERGPLYTLRAVCSNLAPVPRFPQRRYRHYIARREAARHARLLLHPGGASEAHAPSPTVLLIVCADAAGGRSGGRDQGPGESPSDSPLTSRHPPLPHPPTCNPPYPPNWRVLPLDGSVTSSALNAALRGATEDYAAILWPGDSLAPDAAAIVDAALAREPVSSNQSSVATGEDSRPPSHVPRPSLLYTDEDLLDARGRRCQPHFKPGWSPDTLLDWPYTGNLCLFDRRAALACSGFCGAFTTADALLYDLVLRLTERDPRVHHIPAILYHRQTGPRFAWNASPCPTPSGPPATQAGQAVPASCAPSTPLFTELTEARRRAAARRGIPVLFEDAPAAETWQAIRPALGFAPLLSLPRLRPLPPPDVGDTGSGFRVQGSGESSTHSTFNIEYPPPLVSILIPTRNHAADLSACIASIVDRTTYPHLEILIADNGSDEPAALRCLERIAAGLRTAAGAAVPVRVLRLGIPFNFSILNNRAASAAAGDFLLFLNNDTEVVTPDWIERMLGHALKPHTGAVGATLLYPDGTIQHAGVATVGSGPTHVFGHLPADYPHPRCQRDGNWSAVTAACMMVDAGKFRAVGGFDESLAVAFNDVDLCYRLLDRGWHSILASQARLVHHEFKTRGHDRASADKRTRMSAELERLFDRWPALRDDPFYNPALSISYPDFLPQG